MAKGNRSGPKGTAARSGRKKKPKDQDSRRSAPAERSAAATGITETAADEDRLLRERSTSEEGEAERFGDDPASLKDLDTDDLGDNDDIAARLATGSEPDEETREEFGVDNIVGPIEAGVGGGLDEEEEARAGITDEEIAKRSPRR